jgi:two-component sensor histidine kinase/PAS domain-containing protein
MMVGTFSCSSWAPQRLLSRSSLLRRNVELGYAVGLVAFILALALRVALDAAIPKFPFITFIPAVIISAFLAGSRAGTFCAALSFLAAWYWFVDPMKPFSMGFNEIVGLGLFVVIIVTDIAIIEVAARAVDELIAKELQLNTIIETVPVGLVMAEFPSGKIVGANKYVEQMFGRPIVHSASIDDYREWVGFHKDGSRVDIYEYPLVAMMLRGEENPRLEAQHQRQDGSKVWVRIVGRPVRDAKGRITGGVIAVVDIDEQYRTQAALEEALRVKELLLNEVNHRVKNSLHLVNSFLFLEAFKLEEGEAHSAIMSARNKVDLIARVHQLLYEGGTHNRVDMKNAIEEIVTDLVVSAGRGDVNLVFSFSGDLTIKIGQASPLVLVVNEIVTNSIKYGLGSNEPMLSVSAVNAREQMTLVISDNGPGISPTAANRKASLGSQIIEGLVHQMRAEIVVQSAGAGTTIILKVPIDPQSSEREDIS